ncbi:MAG: hypothetical protein HQL21_00115 [Candidatus Omnitrophica bacterium]|nr:hypothetical protein [Candidatus Omnitrophota bacterium]
MKSFLVFLLMFSGILTGNSFAQNNEDAYKILLENYSQAIRTEDYTKIFAAWGEIDKVPEAKIYMEATFPLLAYSFKMTGMTMELARDLEQYLKAYPNAPIRLQTTDVKGTKRTKQTNLDIALSSLNQNQMTNQEQAERDRKAELINNQKTVINNLNQSQRNNQDIMEDEITRMREAN